MPRGRKKSEDIITENTEVVESELSRAKKRQVVTKKYIDVIRKLKSEDPYVLMYCNKSHGSVTYKCPNTNKTYDKKYGEMDYFPYNTIEVMKSNNPKYFEKYWFIPVAVDSEEFELQDILKALGLEDLYTEDILDESNVDFVLKELNYKEFVNFMDEIKKNPKRKAYARSIMDRSIDLAKTGEFNDFTKMGYLKDYAISEGLALKGELVNMYELAIENYNKSGNEMI